MFRSCICFVCNVEREYWAPIKHTYRFIPSCLQIACCNYLYMFSVLFCYYFMQQVLFIDLIFSIAYLLVHFIFSIICLILFHFSIIQFLAVYFQFLLAILLIIIVVTLTIVIHLTIILLFFIFLFVFLFLFYYRFFCDVQRDRYTKRQICGEIDQIDLESLFFYLHLLQRSVSIV